MQVGLQFFQIHRMAMKRKRKSTTYATQIDPKDEQHIQHMGPFITDLPKSILHIVLLKLPPKSILLCKCVCKPWHQLISDPEFAKLHFAQAKACPLIRPCGSSRVSRILYLVEPEDIYRFNLKDCACDYGTSCNRCRIHINLPKYKIPLRNAEVLTHNNDNVNMLHRKQDTKIKRCIKIRPNDHKYKVVNSCNGLLCLSEPFINDPVVICNPITGEFMHLPEASENENKRVPIDCGFGFSPKTNQYKVVRIFNQRTTRPTRVAEIHTLGTGSWKGVGSAPYLPHMLAYPTYLKGAIYWIYYFYGIRDYIAAFDLDNELFHSVPPPPFQLEEYRKVSLGVLGDSLCVCDSYGCRINVWLMKNYGGKKSWMKKISIHTDNFFDGERWPRGLYKPMKYLKNGGLLLFHHRSSALFYYHPRKYKSFIYLKLRGFKSDFEAINHVPSFISLKDILMGGDIEVLNINSRCAELKLLGETRALTLEEEIAELASDFYSSSSGGE